MSLPPTFAPLTPGHGCLWHHWDSNSSSLDDGECCATQEALSCTKNCVALIDHVEVTNEQGFEIQYACTYSE